MPLDAKARTQLLERTLLLTDPARNFDRGSLIQLLDALVRAGFRGARYYDVTLNFVTNDLLLVLSAASPESADLLGFGIDYSSSTIGQGGKAAGPIISSHDSQHNGPNQERWIEKLGLGRSSWVDIPVRFGNRIVALIACDWPSGALDLSLDDLAFLELLATRLALHLMVNPARSAEKARVVLSSSAPSADPVDLLRAIAVELRRAVDGAIVGVFQHHWDSGYLEKIFEDHDPRLPTLPLEFPEVYHLDSSCLTIQAWRDPRARHIVDIQRIAAQQPYSLAKPSVDRHQTLFQSDVVTALYGILGKSEPRYLVRIINRADAPPLPFVDAHKRTFDALCLEWSQNVERMVMGRRLKRLQEVSNGIVEALGDRDRALALILDAIADEGIENSAVLCQSEGSTGFSVSRYFGPLFAGWQQSTPAAFTSDPLYAEAIGITTPSTIEIRKVPDYHNTATLAGRLLAQHVMGVICFPIRALRTRGVLLCPVLSPSGEADRQAARLPKPPQDKLTTLTTYATMIGSCIEAVHSRLTAEHARMLVGHIRHEVNTPASILGQRALAAILAARQKVPPTDVQTLAEFDDHRSGIIDQMGAVNKTMDVALLVAQESRGRLQMQFRKCDFGRLLDEARDSLRSELEVRNPRGKISRYSIDIPDSCKRLGSIVCDADLLKQVFLNLFRNGMKYSLPRDPGRPMVIDVVGMRQTGVSIVQVTNWGIGIPDDDFERIFQPFVRGSVHDRFRAIRGMGLGLYVSRRVMLAHNGTLVCHHSTCTLDDPARRKLWEGFETTMEVRIPHNLPEGVRDHEWEKESTL